MAYDNPNGLIAAAVIVQTLVLLVIGARFRSQNKRGIKMRPSDYLIIVAAALSTALAIEQVYASATGMFGVPLAPLKKSNPKAVPEFLYILRRHNFSFIITGILAIGIIKISASFFYLQIFSTARFRPIIIAWIVIMTIWTIGFFAGYMAICGDHGLFTARRFLDKSNVKNYCGDIGKINYGLVISGTISDLITVLLPIPMVMTLHLRPLEKLSIAGIFLVGFVSVGASAARTYISVSALPPRPVIRDTGFGVTATCVWTLVEIQVGIIAACVPTIRPVIREIAQSGIFDSIMSSARSIVSKKSSRSTLADSVKTGSSEQVEKLKYSKGSQDEK